MDIDVHERLEDVADVIKELGDLLLDPANDLSDLAGIARSLRITAESVEAYVGIQHARNVREAERLA